MGTIKERLALFAALLGIAVAGISAFGMRNHVRAVEIVDLFFGGFGAGAGLVAVIADRRRPPSREDS